MIFTNIRQNNGTKLTLSNYYFYFRDYYYKIWKNLFLK